MASERDVNVSQARTVQSVDIMGYQLAPTTFLFFHTSNHKYNKNDNIN